MPQDEAQDGNAHYQGEYPRDVWEKWKRTVPRSYERLDERITVLLELDTQVKHEGRNIEEIVAEFSDSN